MGCEPLDPSSTAPVRPFPSAAIVASRLAAQSARSTAAKAQVAMRPVSSPRPHRIRCQSVPYRAEGSATAAFGERGRHSAKLPRSRVAFVATLVPGKLAETFSAPLTRAAQPPHERRASPPSNIKTGPLQCDARVQKKTRPVVAPPCPLDACPWGRPGRACLGPSRRHPDIRPRQTPIRPRR